MQGWIKLHRELFDKPIWKNSTNNQRVLLITILVKANFEPAKWPYKGELFDIQSGQFVTSLDKLKKSADMTTQAVRTALDKFAMYGFSTSESTKTGRIITVINWETYQGIDSPNNKDKNSDATKMQQRCNKDATASKNVKKKKNDKNNKEKNSYERERFRIIDYLNKKTGQNLNPDSKDAKFQINGRLNQNYKEIDFKIVIDKKCKEWLGTERQNYLRPATLFCEKHFDQYLNALEPVNQSSQRKPTVGEQNIEFLKNHYRENECNQNQPLIK